eukprot:7378586-Prymnesium_polylepis.4
MAETPEARTVTAQAVPITINVELEGARRVRGRGSRRVETRVRSGDWTLETQSQRRHRTVRFLRERNVTDRMRHAEPVFDIGVSRTKL